MNRLFRTTLAVALLALLLSPALAGRVWEKTAFPSGSIQSGIGKIVAHPVDPDTIYVPTTNAPDLFGKTIDPANGLWRTTDRGDTWTTINDGVLLTEHNISDLAICRAVPDVLYAGTIQAGIFRSMNGGQSWTDVSGGFEFEGAGFPNPRWGVLAVAVDPVDPDKVYISVAQVAGLDMGNPTPDHPGFFYSHDGGMTWTENNAGLPPRFDDASDGQSRTAVAASILVLPQQRRTLLLGMFDVHINTELFVDRTASTDGRIFANRHSGTTGFVEVSSGLPTRIEQSPEVGTSLARLSTSIMQLSVSTGSELNLWATHVGLTGDLGLDTNVAVTRSKGLFFTDDGTWEDRNGGLPFIELWVDNRSTGSNIIRFEDTYNMSSVAIAPGSLNRACLVGAQRSDMGNASTNATKVYATPRRGLPEWIQNWDGGLDQSPTLGYSEANASNLVINANVKHAFASVRWTDDDVTDTLPDDDGIYRVALR